MKRALALFATVLSTCGPVQQVPNCNRVSIVSGEGPAGVSLANQPVTIELLGLLDVICAVNGPVATDVIVSVRDERNLPVVEMHTPPRATGNGFATRVTFTPTSAGVYFLDARFEPAVTATQRKHVVVVDRSDAGLEMISSVDAGCDALHPLGDVLICAKANALTFWRDGNVIDSRTGSVDSDDGVAWVLNAGLIERLELIDGGVRGRATVVPTLSSPARGFERERTVVMTDNTLTEVSFADGGVELRQQALSTSVAFSGVAMAGEYFGWSTGSQLCTTKFGVVSAACRSLPTTRALGERDVLWVKSESAISGLAQWRVFSDGAPPALRAVVSSPVMFDVSQQRPVLSWDGRFVTVRRDDLMFEAWPRVEQVATVTVTPSHVVFRRRSGEVFVYRR